MSRFRAALPYDENNRAFPQLHIIEVGGGGASNLTTTVVRPLAAPAPTATAVNSSRWKEDDDEFENSPLAVGDGGGGAVINTAPEDLESGGKRTLNVFGRIMDHISRSASAPKFSRLRSTDDGEDEPADASSSGDEAAWDNLTCWQKCRRLNLAVFAGSFLLCVGIFLAVAFSSHSPTAAYVAPPDPLPAYCSVRKSKFVSDLAERIFSRSPSAATSENGSLVSQFRLCVIADSKSDLAKSIVAAASPAPSSIFANASVYGERVMPSNDGFELSAVDGVVTITGTSISATSSGLYWYLKNALGVQITWGADQLSTLPRRVGEKLPDWPRVAVASSAPWRHAWNMCTFGYTAAFWGWPRWEQELDWMALHGVNFPLAFVGQEYVWLKAFEKNGVKAETMEKWFAGPAFSPWQRMGNLKGWGGPLPLRWIYDQYELQRKILGRMRELGMTPILPCFAGKVPNAAKEIWPHARFNEKDGNYWNNFPAEYGDVLSIDPSEPHFADIARAFMLSLNETYGDLIGSDDNETSSSSSNGQTDTNSTQEEDGLGGYYACGPYNENDPPSWDDAFLAASSKAVLDGIIASDKRGTWITQGWFLSPGHFPQWADYPNRIKAYLQGVPRDRLIVLDLHAEDGSLAIRYDDFFGRASIWTTLHNYGGVRGMYGNLSHIATQPFMDMQRSSVVGIGFAPEAIEQNPIVYELVTETFFRFPEPISAPIVATAADASNNNDNKMSTSSSSSSATIPPVTSRIFTPIDVFPSAIHLFDAETWTKRYMLQRYSGALPPASLDVLLEHTGVKSSNTSSSSSSSDDGHQTHDRLLHHTWKAWEILFHVFYSDPLQPKTEMERVPLIGGWDSSSPEPLGARLHGTPQAMFYAMEHMLDAIDAGEVQLVSNGENSVAPLHYDLVDIARQTGTTFFTDVHVVWLNAGASLRTPEEIALFNRTTEYLLALIDKLDDVLSTDKNFLLGVWLENAVTAASDYVTESNRTKYEMLFRFNAKNQITMWGPGGQFTTDYARKAWAGLYRNYYKERWRMAAQFVRDVDQGTVGWYDSNAYNDYIMKFQIEWNNDMSDVDANPATVSKTLDINGTARALMNHIALSMEDLETTYQLHQHVSEDTQWHTFTGSFFLLPTWTKAPQQLARLCDLLEAKCVGFTSNGYLLATAPSVESLSRTSSGGLDLYLKVAE